MMDGGILEQTSYALVPSLSVDAILARRDALHAAVRATHAAYLELHARRRALFDGDPSGTATDYDLGLEWHRTRRDFDAEEGLAEAFKRVDARCWGYLLAKSGLEQLMDHAARTEWRQQLEKLVMPEFVRANIDATFVSLASQRTFIFERGVVNVFKSLSHDYKTNTPVKLGKRLIVTYAAECRTWHYPDKHPTKAGRPCTTVYGPTHSFADKLDDLMRVFFVLEGKPEPSHDQGAWAQLSRGDWMKGDVDVGDAPDIRDVALHGLVTFRGFKNGNAHLTFLRPDLVDKLNKIIAKHYPNALPPRNG